MARDPKQLRKAYEYKLGKDLADKLSDVQIASLSNYYNRASEEEQSKIDSELIKGMGDFLDSARALADEGFIREPKLPVQEYKKEDLSEVKAKEDAFNKDEPEDESEDLEGLDDILKEIQEEQEDETEDDEETSKKPDEKAVTALVKSDKKYDKPKPKQQDEEIDPKILEILGLDDVFDLDYDEYRTLLKEKMAADRMGQKVDSGDAELISDEYKRVRNKKGSFSQKKEEVQTAKVVKNVNVRKNKKSTVDANKLLKSSKEVKTKKDDVVTDSFDNINETLVGIDSLLKDILGEEKKEAKQEETTTRKAAQKREEEKSEKSAKKKATFALKGFKPPKMGFFDMIKKFFGNILAGGIVLKMLDWIRNKENQKKIQNVVTFITDNLDKILLGIVAILGIGIGAKILGFLGLFTPLVTGLVVVLKGLLGLLIGPAGLIALVTAALWKGGQEGGKAVQDLINRQRGGGQKETEDGVRYSDKSVESLRQSLSLLLQQTDKRTNIFGLPDWAKPYSEGEKREFLEGQLQKLKELQKRIRTTKSVNDDLYRIQLNLKKENAELERLRSSNASADKIERQEKFVKNLEKQVKTFTINKEQSVKIEQKLIGEVDFDELLKDPRIADSIPDEIKDTLNKTTSARDSLSDEDKKVTPGSLPPSAANIEATPQTQMIPSSNGTPDVIIPLDHARGRIPDKTGGNTFTAAGQTGAYNPITGSTERDYQDPAAAMLKAELAKSGVKAKIVRPEDFASYEEYDNFLRKMDQNGVVSVPLHFDAIRSASGKGYLTRTRPGDAGDAKLAAPINEVLKQFQRENSDTGIFSPDTQQNTTVDLSRKSPAALVELGIMAELETKFGKNYTKHPKFIKLIQGLSGAIIEGGGFTVSPEVKPSQKLDPPRPPNTDQASVIPIGGSSGSDIASASTGGRAAAASFSSTDKNNNSPMLTGSVYNLGAVV